MSWRERLRTATFRGVPFRFEEISDSVGRVKVRHDFAGRPLPFVEDLGRRAREFRMRAYVVGENYLDELDALIDALETEGPGVLVHPTAGTFNVSLLDLARISQSKREGGIATLELTFVEDEGALTPVAAAVPGPELEDRSDAAADAAAALFPSLVQVDGTPESTRQAIADAVASSLDLLSSLELPADSQDLAAWRRRVGAMQSGGATLAAEPTLFALELRGVIGDVENLAGGKLPALEVFRALLRLPSIVVPGRGSTALISASNARRSDNLGRMVAFSGATKVAARAPWESLEQALDARKDLLALSEQLEAEADPRDLANLQDLRGLLGAAVPPPDKGLPRRREVTPATTIPSLALAYQLDGNTAGELELVERNRPPYPGFLPGGVPLEVLDRV